MGALSGTIGSVLAEVVLFPVDTIKLQVQTGGPSDSGGLLATAAQIILRDGVGGLYRGLGGAMLKESMHSLNFWLWHGFLFRYVTQFDDTSATHPLQRLLLNLLAKQLNWLCTVPFEVISSLNQLAPGSPGFLATAASLYQAGGITIFYRGLPVSLILAVNPAIMNTLITSMLRVVARVRQSLGRDFRDARDHSAAAVGIVTGVAKGIATILTYPLIRAKVLQQTHALGSDLGLGEVLRSTVAAEGPGGLYRGMLAMSFKTVLWNSLMMAFKHLLAPMRQQTPPSSPPRSPQQRAAPMMPFMAREPFPVELLTVEKLNQILSYLQHKDSSVSVTERVRKIEDRLMDLSADVRAMTGLLAQLVESTERTRTLDGKPRDGLPRSRDGQRIGFAW